MSGAYCKDPKVASKSLDDYPCVFNIWGSDMFDWGAAFPDAASTFGTFILYAVSIGFGYFVMGHMDAGADEVLGYMLIFTGLQFIPYIGALVITNGPNPIKGLFLNLVYRPDLPPVGIEYTTWAKRAAAAQKENTNALTIFAPAVLLFLFRHASKMDDIKYLCWGFMIARLVHYVFLVGPIGSPQPIPGFATVSFLASIFCSTCILVLALQSKTSLVAADALVSELY